MDDVRIRPATRDDIDRLREVELDAGAAFRVLGMDVVADGPPPSAVVLGGFVDRGAAWVLSVASAVAAYRLDAVVDGVSHLEQVSVDPAFARRGLGRRLIEHLADHHGAVTLTTYTDVPWNGPYYARLGFRRLADDELGPGLRAIRRTEAARGLDRWPRCAMRRDP